MYPQNLSTPAHPPAGHQHTRQDKHPDANAPSAHRGRPNGMGGPMDWHRYWMDRAERELSLRNSPPSTRATYLAALKEFLHHHPRAPSTLRADAIGRYLLSCREDRGLSPATVNTILAALVFFYQHVVKAPYCLAGIPRMKEDKRPPDLLGPASVKALIDGTAHEMHRLALSLAYGCGLRVSELAHLKWDDLDFENGELHIRKSKGSKGRVVMIPQSLIGAIRAYRAGYQPISYIFESKVAGRPISRRAFQALFDKIRGAHQPENGTDLRFIQALLGHSDNKTAERYTHVTEGNITEAESPMERRRAA